MSYCHRTKIGNQGDLVKHFALTTAIRHFTIKHSPFRYMDVHCGYADYDLHQQGEWLQGIGRFAELCATTDSLDTDVEYFYKLHRLQQLAQIKHYRGSSKIVARSLQDRGIEQAELHLCDIQSDVCKSLATSYQGDPGIHIYCEDGYHRARQLPELDLIFIDPPDIRQQFGDYMDLLKHCMQHGQPFIAWNSLHGNSANKGMAERCRQIQALACSSGTAQIRVKWQPGWPQNMCGCQMLFGLDAADRLLQACESLARLMQWEISLGATD